MPREVLDRDKASQRKDHQGHLCGSKTFCQSQVSKQYAKEKETEQMLDPGKTFQSILDR